MDKTIVWVIIVTIIVLLFLGIGVFISLKLKKPSITIGDLERECLMKKAVENCNGFCIVQMCKENYSCQACCGHSGIIKHNFTEQEMDKCNLTKWMEYG
jgi:flagellar basal body-associated protein FliL